MRCVHQSQHAWHGRSCGLRPLQPPFWSHFPTTSDGSSSETGECMTSVLLVASVLALLTPAQSPATEQQQPTIRSATQAATQTGTLKVSGMTCASCDVAVRLAAKSVSGVKTVTVDYPKAKAEVTYDPSKTNPRAIADAITKVSEFKTEPVKSVQK